MITIYGRDVADGTAKTEIAGDTMLEVLQFMIRKKQQGLMVFDSVSEANMFARELIAKANTPLLFYMQSQNAFRCDGTWLYFAVLDTPHSLERVRGQQFHRIWWCGSNAMLEYRPILKACCLRLSDGQK